jgi:hypothetical protein
MAHPKKVTAMAKYSFADDGGGSPGAITLNQTESIPNNAVITDVWTYTDTLCVGSGATIAITGGGVTLSAATAITNNAYDTNEQVSHHTGLISSNLGIKATSTADIGITTASAALSAGIFTIWVEYYLLDAEA